VTLQPYPPISQAYKESKWFETAYVVKLFSYAPLAEAQPVFTFVHPNRAAAIDNRRYAVLRFTARTAGLIHGFAGYFDCTLHGDVHISINPASHSPHMMSWFPLYFPLREPVYAREGELIEARMWRCVSSSKVWYEWALTAPQVTPIHNPMGRSYYIGL
jgi:protein arginine N-methyltransferase 5